MLFHAVPCCSPSPKALFSPCCPCPASALYQPTPNKAPPSVSQPPKQTSGMPRCPQGLKSQRPLSQPVPPEPSEFLAQRGTLSGPAQHTPGALAFHIRKVRSLGEEVNHFPNEAYGSKNKNKNLRVTYWSQVQDPSSMKKGLASWYGVRTWSVVIANIYQVWGRMTQPFSVQSLGACTGHRPREPAGAVYC